MLGRRFRDREQLLLRLVRTQSSACVISAVTGQAVEITGLTGFFTGSGSQWPPR
jgi:hypothetical protein